MLAVVVLPCVPATAIVAPQPRHLAEQVAAVEHRRTALARPRELRVVVADRGRDDDLRPLGHVRGVVPDRRLDPGVPQQRDVARLGLVRARDLGAERACDQREPAHPRAPDADEVEPAAGPWRRAHSARP